MRELSSLARALLAMIFIVLLYGVYNGTAFEWDQLRGKTASKAVTPDGDYPTLMLPCKCGGLTVYKPGSCGCFDPENYPELSKRLAAVYGWAQKNSEGAVSTKPVGKYEVLTLECGCSLKLYRPGSCGCVAKRYPDLEKLLTDLWQEAKRNQPQDP